MNPWCRGSASGHNGSDLLSRSGSGTEKQPTGRRLDRAPRHRVPPVEKSARCSAQIGLSVACPDAGRRRRNCGREQAQNAQRRLDADSSSATLGVHCGETSAWSASKIYLPLLRSLITPKKKSCVPFAIPFCDLSLGNSHGLAVLPEPRSLVLGTGLWAFGWRRRQPRESPHHHPGHAAAPRGIKFPVSHTPRDHPFGWSSDTSSASSRLLARHTVEVHVPAAGQRVDGVK